MNDEVQKQGQEMPDTPMSPQDAREHARRLQFIHAAEPLFERYGFKKTTVEEICEGAKASKRTFYEVYNDKSDLFIDILLHLTNEMIDNYKESIRDVPSAIERLHHYIDSYINIVTARPVFAQVLENPKLLHQMTDGVHDGVIQMEQIVNAFTELLQYGIETGEFRQMNPAIVTWIIHALMDGLYIMAMDMHPKDGFVESQEFLDEVKNFILKGLGVTDSGGRLDRAD